MTLYSGQGDKLDGDLKSLCKNTYSKRMHLIINNDDKAETKWADYVKNCIEKLKGKLGGNQYAGINIKVREFLFKTWKNGEGTAPKHLTIFTNTSYTKDYVKEKGGYGEGKDAKSLGTHRVIYEWIKLKKEWELNRVFYTNDHNKNFYIMEYWYNGTIHDNY